jgi:hypothetical protein
VLFCKERNDSFIFLRVKDQDWWGEVLFEIMKYWTGNKNTEDSY